MKYFEYLQNKTERKTNDNATEFNNPYKITCKEQYLEMMEAIHTYREDPRNFEFTQEDFEEFEKSFQQLIDYLTGEDLEDDEQTVLERIINEMKRSDWRWVGKTVTEEMFIDELESMFKQCMNHEGPTYGVSTGGITFKTNVEDHSIEFYFGIGCLYAMPDDVY